MPKNTSISIDPTTAHWGGTTHATATSSATSPWMHAEVFQGDTLVFAQYVRGTDGTFYIGPTPAADETQPGDGRVEIGYWARNGTYRATAVTKLHVEP